MPPNRESPPPMHSGHPTDFGQTSNDHPGTDSASPHQFLGLRSGQVTVKAHRTNRAVANGDNGRLCRHTASIH